MKPSTLVEDPDIFYRFGYACVNFGPCISMKDFCREHGIRFHRLGKEERLSNISDIGFDSKNICPFDQLVSIHHTGFLHQCDNTNQGLINLLT